MKGNMKGTAKAQPAAESRHRVTRGKRAPAEAMQDKEDVQADRATSGDTHARHPKQTIVRRLPRTERRALVLAKAADYFSEHGLEAQTRAIAEVCGVSQRLLYSLFPSKAALIEEVYNHEIAGLFKAIWFVNLKDRGTPIEARLIAFYREYYETLLTRRWLRLFLFSSLAGLSMAPTYSNAVISHALEIVVTEAAHEAGRSVPPTIDGLKEVGWILHGAISHLAIRRRIYGHDDAMPVEDVIAMTVRAFLASVPALLPPLPPA